MTYSFAELKEMLPDATVCAGSVILVKENMVRSNGVCKVLSMPCRGHNQTVAAVLEFFKGYRIEVWGEIRQ